MDYLTAEHQLTSHFDEAVAYASTLHRDQARKGTTIPYLSHLLGVAGLVLEAGGTEEQAIAGLLHDALEDQGHRTSYEEIAERFGTRLRGSCGSAPTPKSCRSRRGGSARSPTSRISPLSTRRCGGSASPTSCTTCARWSWTSRRTAWRISTRSAPGPVEQVWYFESLAEVFSKSLPGAHATEMAATVERLRAAVL